MRFASVRRAEAEIFIVLYSPVAGSKTRFLIRLTFQARRVWRSEWLRVLPNVVFLPVLAQMRAIRLREGNGIFGGSQPEFLREKGFSRFSNDGWLLYCPVMPFIQPTYIIAVLIALSIHEWAHAFAAWKLGDNTAKYQGRLTINPLSHLDPIGSLMFLLVGFGWAKPVPVNPLSFKHITRDTAITAFAGPLSNLILAFVSYVVLSVVGALHGGSMISLLDAGSGLSPAVAILMQILGASVYVNLALMAFNLFPVAPLDGSKILPLFLPSDWHFKYDELMQYGQWILLALVFGESLLPFPILSAWVHGIMNAVLSAFGLFAGWLF